MVAVCGLNGFPVRSLNGGVGMVASRARIIKPGFEFDAYFPKPTYENPYLSKNADNEDTLDKFIPEMARKYQSDTERIAIVLKSGTLITTCRNIWNFVYNHIQYKLDDPHEEQIRRPARTWADRTSGVDCDCYSVFISSILLNLGIRHYIRMTAYNTQRGFQHVYVIVPKTPTSNLDKRSDYIVIDCVMDAFDSEKPFISKKDKEMTPANSAGLNGFTARSLNGAFQSRSNLVYDDVYYIPSMGAWALKGIDGGYYIRGNSQQRYVEPLNGVDGLFKKVIKTAVKATKPIAKKVVKNVVKAAKKAAIPLAKNALNVAIPGSASVLTAISTAKGAIAKPQKAIADFKKKIIAAPQKVITNANQAITSGITQAFADGGAALSVMANDAIAPINNMVEQIPSQVNFDTSALESKLRASNNNTVQSLDTAKNVLQKSIQANNKAVITSLDNVDKASKERLDKMASELNDSLTKVKEKASTTEEATKMIQEIAAKTASISAGTQAINREQSEVIKTESQKNENFRNQINTWGKYALIAFAIVIVWFLMNKQKQPTI